MNIGTGANCTSNGEYITLTTSTSGQKDVIFPTSITDTDDWSFEIEVAKIGVVQSVTSSVNSNNYLNINDTTLIVWKYNNETGNHTQNISAKAGDIIKWVYENGTLKYYYNNQLISSKSQSFTIPLIFKTYTNKDGSTARVQYIKNIKIRLL